MFVALRGFYNFYTHLKHNSFYTRTSSTITAFTFEADMKVADSRLDTDKGNSFQPYLHIPRLRRSRLLDYESETFKWEMVRGREIVCGRNLLQKS
jgi:hypothetical protein